MAQNSIRIGESKKLKIEVNDDGDYITLDFTDGSFLKRFKEFAKTVETNGKEYEKEVKAISLKATTDENNGEEIAEADFNFNQKLAVGIDNLFGVGTCVKVFGYNTPSGEAVAEFLEALQPYVANYIQDRKATVSSKYSAKKKGGSR